MENLNYIRDNSEKRSILFTGLKGKNVHIFENMFYLFIMNGPQIISMENFIHLGHFNYLNLIFAIFVIVINN